MILFRFINMLVVKGFFCNLVRHRSFFISAFSERDYFLNKSWDTATSTSVPLSTGVTEEASADVSVGSGDEAGVYYCHQGSCIRVFYRLSTLLRYLSMLKCTQSVERHSLMDLAKLCYKPCLEQTLARY